MRYRDAQEVLIGDVVEIDSKYRGLVVGCIEGGAYLQPHSQAMWSYLQRGALVDTDFGGVIHYPDDDALASENMNLLRRAA